MRTPLSIRRCLLSAILATAVAAPARADDPGQDVASDVVPGQIAPRLQTPGTHAHPITTS